MYQIDDEDFNNRPKNFYITLGTKGKEVYYSNKGFDEVVANFVGIDIAYIRRSVSFSSKSPLHQYLKAGYTREPQAPFSLPTQLFLPISIIEFQLIVPLLRSVLAFESWTYATTSVIFVSHLFFLELNPSTIACLDINYRLTLVNKMWLLYQLLDQKISAMLTSLKIRGIETLKYKLLQFADVSLYLPGKNQVGKLVYILIKCELYLVDNL